MGAHSADHKPNVHFFFFYNCYICLHFFFPLSHSLDDIRVPSPVDHMYMINEIYKIVLLMLIVDLISLSYCTAVAILSIVLWCSTWLILIPFDSACLNN